MCLYGLDRAKGPGIMAAKGLRLLRLPKPIQRSSNALLLQDIAA
jgi:hypothetical protein